MALNQGKQEWRFKKKELLIYTLLVVLRKRGSAKQPGMGRAGGLCSLLVLKVHPNSLSYLRPLPSTNGHHHLAPRNATLLYSISSTAIFSRTKVINSHVTAFMLKHAKIGTKYRQWFTWGQIWGQGPENRILGFKKEKRKGVGNSLHAYKSNCEWILT